MSETKIDKGQQKLLDRIGRIYLTLPFKPVPPPLAKQYAFKGEQEALAGRWRQAEHAYRQAIAMAPWWAEAHYNTAMVWYAGLDALPAAIREMEIYLRLAEKNDPERTKAKRRLRFWQDAVDEYIRHGAVVSDDFPYLITPDLEAW